MPCGGRKTSPRISTIVQFIFYFGPLRSAIIFWEIRQVFIYLDPILIYISLWINCLFEIRKIAVCVCWLSLPGDYRVTDEALLAETTWYDLPPFLWMFLLLLQDPISDFIFDFTAAGVVPCGGHKTSPRTSTIVQFIFYFGPLRSAIIFWEIGNKWLV